MQYANAGNAVNVPTPAIQNALNEADECVKELYNAVDHICGGVECISKPMPPTPGAASGTLKEASSPVSPVTERLNTITRALRECTSRLHYARERLEI